MAYIWTYRRSGRQSEGRWGVRAYLGDGKYEVASLATADDVRDADGSLILDFDQAQQIARTVANGMVKGNRHTLTPVTVNDVTNDYLEYKRDRIKSFDHTRYVVGRKNSIGVVKLPIGTHDAARRGPVLI